MSADPDQAPRPLAEVREELRRRGYLDSGLDRLLLGTRPSDPLLSPLRVALRAGLLGGPLVGVGVAVATWAGAGRPGLSRLALLVAVFSLLFAGLLAVLEVCVALLARRSAARGGSGAGVARLAIGAGFVAALYLGAWWLGHRRRLPPAGALDVLWIGLLALVGFGIARLTSVAGAAGRAGGALAHALPLPERLRRPRALATLLPLVVLAAIGLALWRGLESRPVPHAVAPLVATPGRLIVVGVDGMGEELWRRARREGYLTDEGGPSPVPTAVRRLQREPDGEPPARWTTLATGQPPGVHGVQGVEWRSVARLPVAAPGLLAPLLASVQAVLPFEDRLIARRTVTATIRRSPAVWEIIGGGGQAVVVIGWWATSPLPDLPGRLLSDRAWAARLGSGTVRGEALPEAWAAMLDRGAPSPAPASHGPSEPGDALLQRGLAADSFHVDAFLSALALSRPRAAFLYLSSLDIVGAASRPGAAGLLSGAADLTAALEQLAAKLRRIRSALRPDDLLVLLLDPGRSAAPGETGLILVTGREALAGDDHETGAAPPVDPLAVAPTLLWMSGYPVSTAMAAPPVTELLRAEARALRPVARADPGAPPPPSRLLHGSGASETRAREHLRSLGYIE